VSEVVVVGGGAVGVNAALFLARMGFGVELVESAPEILQGSPRASFVNHGDGFEYYKPGHRRTGEHCIDGTFTKGLIYPLEAFRTPVCDQAHPIRFLVAKGSVGHNGLTLEAFAQNAEHMRAHFTRQFETVRAATGWTEEETERRFLRGPASFGRRLEARELTDVPHVAGGYAGSSFGINMPHYHAFLKAALRRTGVPCHLASDVEGIERDGSRYRLIVAGREIRARHVLLTSGHHVPRLSAGLRGAAVTPPQAGTYFLNSITFLRLPASGDEERLRAARRINFTLQQDHGSMFACVVPPTSTEDGFAATYYPSAGGSQLYSHAYDPDRPVPPPPEWDQMIAEGLPPDHPNVRGTVAQAFRLYPFLRGYAEVQRTVCDSVFNASTPTSNQGGDRRVREIPAGSIVSDDGQVTAWTSPKWTNAELVALMAADHVCAQLRGHGLAKDRGTRFGPTALDVAEIARDLHFFDVQMRVEDAIDYARRQGVPEKIVDHSLPYFEGHGTVGMRRS
jgi:glycine/D-amino acid oxidase-like deaminating enzyme